MKTLINEDKEKIDKIIFRINSMSWKELSLISICALKKIIPIWNNEIKGRYIVYADRVCGMIHKIDKGRIEHYIDFLENNFSAWGNTDKVEDKDILELWVAATDYDFDISRKGFYILMAAFALMVSIGDVQKTGGYYEVFAHLSQVFDEIDDFETFFGDISNDLINHRLFSHVCPIMPDESG